MTSLSNRDICGEFSKYGWCDITVIYPAFRFKFDVIESLLEADIRIMLNPKEIDREETDDAKVRAGMYAQAEEAIKYARTTYRLTDGPRVTLSGHLFRQQFFGESERDPYIVTEGTLEMRIRNRDAD